MARWLWVAVAWLYRTPALAGVPETVARVRTLGASGVMQPGNAVQAVFRPLSENLKADLEWHVPSGDAAAAASSPRADQRNVPTPAMATTRVGDRQRRDRTGGLGQRGRGASAGRDNLREWQTVALTWLGWC